MCYERKCNSPSQFLHKQTKANSACLPNVSLFSRKTSLEEYTWHVTRWEQSPAVQFPTGKGYLGLLCRRDLHYFDFQLESQWASIKGLKWPNYAGFEALWLNFGLIPCLRFYPSPACSFLNLGDIFFSRIILFLQKEQCFSPQLYPLGTP